MLRSGSNPSRQRNSISVGKLVGAGIFLSVASIAVSTWFSLHHILQHQYPSHDPQPMPVMTSPYGLIVPEGPATALPSVFTTPEEQASIDRKFYGGKASKMHAFCSYNIYFSKNSSPQLGLIFIFRETRPIWVVLHRLTQWVSVQPYGPIW